MASRHLRTLQQPLRASLRPSASISAKAAPLQQRRAASGGMHYNEPSGYFLGDKVRITYKRTFKIMLTVLPSALCLRFGFTWIRYGLPIAILCTTAWASEGRLGEHLHVRHVWRNGSLRGALHVQARYNGADMGVSGSGKYECWSQCMDADTVL